MIRRISRDATTRLAKDDERLKPFVRPVVPYMRELLSKRERIIIEGTQGFGLSLLHTPYYPYATSRDTTAAAFVSEAGLSPMDVDDVVLVIRTYPIRVGGNSGPLPNETDWQSISEGSSQKFALQEFTSVTKTIRRVAKFDHEIVCNSIIVNNPSRIVLNHLDYIDNNIFNTEPSEKCMHFIDTFVKDIKSKIHHVGTGPKSIYGLDPDEACQYELS